MQIKRTIALCLLLLTAHAAAAQFVCTYRHIITVYSTNGDYCARATPYYNFDLSPYGKTEVFDARTNQLLYTIPECLSKGFLYLSNDGASVLHLVNLEYKSEDEAFSHVLTLYHNGTKAKQVSLRELTSCDGCEEVSSLFFRIEDTVVYEDGRLKAKYNYSATQCEQALHKRPPTAEDTPHHRRHPVSAVRHQLLRPHKSNPVTTHRHREVQLPQWICHGAGVRQRGRSLGQEVGNGAPRRYMVSLLQILLCQNAPAD